MKIPIKTDSKYFYNYQANRKNSQNMLKFQKRIIKREIFVKNNIEICI